MEKKITTTDCQIIHEETRHYLILHDNKETFPEHGTIPFMNKKEEKSFVLKKAKEYGLGDNNVGIMFASIIESYCFYEEKKVVLGKKSIHDKTSYFFDENPHIKIKVIPLKEISQFVDISNYKEILKPLETNPKQMCSLNVSRGTVVYIDDFVMVSKLKKEFA